ncbi:MAG: immunity protein 19 [Anaerotruncus sp.]|nr:immunity protein 19 [Anaerotruncus sp.]
MEQHLTLADVPFSNRNFWEYFFGSSYPNAYDETSDTCVIDLLGEPSAELVAWADELTQYHDGILEECDGYLEHPSTLETMLPDGQQFKIEFHPGDILFFLDGTEIGCTGPHWELQKIPYTYLKTLLPNEPLFLLLLPLVQLTAVDTHHAEETLLQILPKLFSSEICASLVRCLICGIENIKM